MTTHRGTPVLDTIIFQADSALSYLDADLLGAATSRALQLAETLARHPISGHDPDCTCTAHLRTRRLIHALEAEQLDVTAAKLRPHI